MSVMEYDEDIAKRVEAIYLGPDVVAQRAYTLELLAVSKGERVLDIGSGPGFLASQIADQTGSTGEVVGIDISDIMVTGAKSKNTHSWLNYKVADATSLPYDNESFDVVVSTQVAEYVPNIDAFCSEFARVLKKQGRGLIVATDWNAICWYSSDPDRMNKILTAFAPHCADSRLSLTLGLRLRQAGLKIKAQFTKRMHPWYVLFEFKEIANANG